MSRLADPREGRTTPPGAPAARARPAARAAALALAVALVGPVGTKGAAAQQEDLFPHEDHAGLFPVCTGCHEGAESGDAGAMHPEPAVCVTCHDGREEELVFWRGPSEGTTNLRFDHGEHAAETMAANGRDSALACRACHAPEGAPRMRVERSATGRCFDCHSHRAEDHYVDAVCSTCHRPLAETRFSGERVAALPEPSTHEDPDFLARVHAERAGESLASCTTCHTRERCVSCHVDPDGVEAVTRMARSPAGMELPSFEARYSVPATHRRDEWLETHGRDVQPADCSTCHTRESCTTCHVEDEPSAVARLPARRDVPAPGADVRRSEPASHESPFFVEDHEARAAAGGASCQACHATSTCAECHQKDRETAYHPPDFALQHASRAYGQQMECASCHDASVFCRDCHAQLGMEAGRGRGGDFHDGTPAWLLRHGQAARQGLESCTTCHGQRDCLQCHAETGAFRVSPHGPGFDARRMFDRNPQICFACHLSNPVDESRP
jgi:hypothetical protein